MEVELIFKIAAVGILVAVLNILLSRSGRDEQALMTTITALVVVLIVVVQKISELFELIKKIFFSSDGDSNKSICDCGGFGDLHSADKKNNGEIGLAVAIAAAAVICFAAAQLFGSIMELVRYAIGQTGLSSALFMPIIKCVGIAIIVKIGSGLCKDAGQSGIASSLEMLGSAAALFTAIPVISSLLKRSTD